MREREKLVGGSHSKWLCWNWNPAIWHQRHAFNHQAGLPGWGVWPGYWEKVSVFSFVCSLPFHLSFGRLYFEACLYFFIYFSTKKIFSRFPVKKSSRAHALWARHSWVAPCWHVKSQVHILSCSWVVCPDTLPSSLPRVEMTRISHC